MTKSAETLQVGDDPRLLEMMLKDTAAAPDVFKPTNYWKVYEKRFLPELRKRGLRDFRRWKHQVLLSFGANDLWPRREIDLTRTRILNNRVTRTIPFWSSLLRTQSAVFNRLLPFDPGISMERVARLAFEVARAKGIEAGAQPIDRLDSSLYGNPESVVSVNGNAYTLAILQYYLTYAYCCRFVDFSQITVLAELGSGSGKQIEVLKKLHPRICFFVFDIPPQLYVCHQYLRAVFPDAVVPYEETRNLETIPRDREGKIFVFGNWKFPIVNDTQVDLLWNAQSFQEMEPEVVLNYLRSVNRQTRFVFLQEEMRGMEVTHRRGRYGVLAATTLEHYKQGLRDFQLVDLSPGQTLFGPSETYSNSIWERVQQPSQLA